jgi:hypothetical protein
MPATSCVVRPGVFVSRHGERMNTGSVCSSAAFLQSGEHLFLCIAASASWQG